MLAMLVSTPKSQAEWDLWSYAHRDQHALIRQAIQAQYGINLTDYPIDPILTSESEQWQEWNQQLHDDFNAVLGTQSSDLEDTDFQDPDQLQQWIYQHRREHENAALKLKI